MTPSNNLQIQVLANDWAEQLKTDPTFTTSDAEELKGHLIDLCEELRVKGLSEEESFIIASQRIGDFSNMKTEFEEINTPIIQMRKVLLVLSGILVFFLLYYLMRFTTDLFVFTLYWIKDNPEGNIRIILFYIIAYHLFFIISAIFLNFWGAKIIEINKTLKIKPLHTFFTLLCVVGFAISDQFFYQIIRAKFEIGSYSSNHLYTFFDYISYSFPLVIAICFLFLFKKYYHRRVIKSNSDFACQCGIIDQDGQAIVEDNQLEEQSTELQKIGLDKDEIQLLVARRKGQTHYTHSDYSNNHLQKGMSLLLIAFSGVLVYFFLYFLFFSSTRILFTILQYIKNDPIVNIRHTWSYAIIFQMVFIFITVSLYLHDGNLLQQIKRINFRPVHTRWLFWTTFFLATVDRCFYPISKFSTPGDFASHKRLYQIFFYSNYSFPLIVCSCFLLLFNKYYKDNTKIG